MTETLANKSDWDVICEAGREAGKEIDEGRWILGDLACLVEKSYGEDKIGQFAIESNVPKKRVGEYRTVCSFYEKSARAAFREDHPGITYSHMRLAMKLEKTDSAYGFLEKANDNLWTVEQCQIELKGVGGSKILLKANARLVSATPDGCITFAVDPALMAGLQEHVDHFVNVVIKAVQQ